MKKTSILAKVLVLILALSMLTVVFASCNTPTNGGDKTTEGNGGAGATTEV